MASPRSNAQLVSVRPFNNQADGVMPLTRLFCRWTVIIRFWHAGYRPFEEIGSDNFFLTTSSGNMLVTCDPTVVQEIFSRPNDFKAPVDIMSIYNIYGPTLAAAEDDDWRRHRKITSPYFNSATNHAVWKETLKQTDSYLENWKRTASDIVDAKSQLAARIIMSMFGKVFFGKEIRWEDYNADDEKTANLHTFGEAILAVTNNLGIILIIQSLPVWVASKYT
jgi:cytochrome P450